MKLLFSVSLSLLVSTACLAAPVVKWRDAQGQWHFGTPATAPKHQATKPVYVEQPMSVVQNTNPLPKFSASVQQRSAQHADKHEPSKPSRLSKQACDQLRDRLKMRSKYQDHRDAQLYYEQQCVMGRYYGDSND